MWVKKQNKTKKKSQFEVQKAVFQDVLVWVFFFSRFILIIYNNTAWNMFSRNNEVLIKGKFTAAPHFYIFLKLKKMIESFLITGYTYQWL